MARSVFCATPPGQTQDSIRVFRAIIKGCIPVTFYRGNDRPFERHLHVRPSAFLAVAPHFIAYSQVRICDHDGCTGKASPGTRQPGLVMYCGHCCRVVYLMAMTCHLIGILHVTCQSPARYSSVCGMKTCKTSHCAKLYLSMCRSMKACLGTPHMGSC